MALPTTTAGTPAASSASMSAMEPTPPLAITSTSGNSPSNVLYSPTAGPPSIPSLEISVTIVVRSPSGMNFYGKQLCETEVMCCSFSDAPKFCNIYTLENLAAMMDGGVKEEPIVPLHICDRLHDFLCLLGDCMDDGILCAHFHQLKLQELFLLLRAYYSKEDLARMFSPILGIDAGFRKFVLEHYREFVDIRQFASLANMTVSTFQRKFKHEFKKPVNEWLLDRKCELVIRDLKTSLKTINEISEDYGFSSLQYFSNFCKRQFGKTPTELRLEPF